MKMVVNLQEDTYPIYIKQGILSQANTYIKEIFSGHKIMILSDDQVHFHYGTLLTKVLEQDFVVESIVIPNGESSKSFAILPSIYQSLIQFKLARTDLIIALGGGVIGDLAGFVAATYLRGISLVQIPTSLLAQVDSSVGGKVAVNLSEGKNLVGTFYHPKLVLIDPLTLLTLPTRFINDGMGEVIKYGCIKDAELFEQINRYENFNVLFKDIDTIIYRCIDIKREIVEKDPYDLKERLVLNFGHTLGHAIEQYHNYSMFSHGEAVAIGMVQITKIAEELGLTEVGTAKRIKNIVKKYHLPYQSHIESKALMEAISLDKKNMGKKLNLILLHAIGDSFIYQTEGTRLLTRKRV